MVLLATVPGATTTQKFGVSGLSVEPSMWYTAEKAYWLWYPGADFSADFHPGIDRSAPQGTPMRAMEDGTVTFAGWKDSISGFQVEVEIRPGTRFSCNHLSVVRCRVGQQVQKGATIGHVGATGATTGPHTHEGLSIREEEGGTWRTMLYNPALFMTGGRYANDKRVQPLQQFVQVNGAGINIRRADADLTDRASIYAVTRDDGIYRVGTGNRIGPLRKRFPFIRFRDAELGQFAIVTGFGQRLAIHRSLVHFT